jgi:hypothetical protein
MKQHPRPRLKKKKSATPPLEQPTADDVPLVTSLILSLAQTKHAAQLPHLLKK